MKKLLVLLALVFSTEIAHAASYQLRPQLHVQRAWGDGQVGVAAWVVIPDATVAKLKLFFVAGPLIKRSGYWVEIMSGGYVDQTGAVDPVIDVRASIKARKWNVFSEGLRTLKTRRTIFFANSTYPVGTRVRIGAEVEYHIQPSGELFIGGPRAELLLGSTKSPSRVKLVTSYQRGDDGSEIVRNYLVFTW